MKLKLALSTATALGLLMGAALADENDASFIQGGFKNLGTIEQSGGNNEADLNQNGSNSDAAITQTGTSGQVGLTTNGNNNSATITQSGIGNYVGDDDALVPTPSQMRGPIVQNGDENTLEIIQAGQNNDIDQGEQTGDENFLKIRQGDTGNNNNTIVFSQRANPDGNVTGNGSREITDMEDGRNGSPPASFEDPIYSRVSGDTNKWGYLNQQGSGNFLSVDQDAIGNGAYGNGVIAHQIGIDGVIDLSQLGGANLAYFDQRGSDNFISLGQNNEGANDPDNYNLADLRQGGSGNAIFAVQGGQRQDLYVDQTQASSSQAIAVQTNGTSDNYIALVQDGIGHKSSVLQEGSENEASVLQDGNDLSSDLIQSGDLNDAYINQIGNDHVSQVTQSGYDGTVVVVQVGDVGNTSNIAQSGTSNTASVLQE